MKISVIIIALNEEKALPDLLNDLSSRSYDHRQVEVILVDGLSQDRTKQIMQDYAESTDFARVLCLDNPKAFQPCGWNVALAHVDADVIIRLDAHARIPSDFLEKNAACIQAGHDICGGKVMNHIAQKTRWSTAVNAAEDSMFGGSVAAFRHKDQPCVVKTLAFAAYRKEVFDKVGTFNEQLVRTEDNEMHYRMRQAGFEFYYTPEIVSSRETRPTFRKLLRQKYLNGYWIGITLGIEPRCFSLYHFVPLAFVLSILAVTIMMFFGIMWPSAALWIAYGAANLLMTVTAVINDKDRNICFALLPVMFLLLHIGYGVGTFLGVMKAIKGKNG